MAARGGDAVIVCGHAASGMGIPACSHKPLAFRSCSLQVCLALSSTLFSDRSSGIRTGVSGRYMRYGGQVQNPGADWFSMPLAAAVSHQKARGTGHSGVRTHVTAGHAQNSISSAILGIKLPYRLFSAAP